MLQCVRLVTDWASPSLTPFRILELDIVGKIVCSWVGELFLGGNGGGAAGGTTTGIFLRKHRGLLPGEIIGLAELY